MIGHPRGPALLLGIVAAVVVLVLGVALFVLDSPAEERQRRLDERRVEDLGAIADAVEAYRSREGELPPDLDTLADWEGFRLSPTDPVSGAPYEYRVTDVETYELCADFTTEAPGHDGRRRWRRHGTLWHHPAGEHCFELEVEGP